MEPQSSELTSPGSGSEHFSDAAEFGDTASFMAQEESLPMDSMGFNIVTDDEPTSYVQNAMLLTDDRMRSCEVDDQMGSSGVWECDACYYVNNGVECGGCGQPFDQEGYTQRLGDFSTTPPEPEPDPSELAATAKAAYHAKLEACAAESVVCEMERKRLEYKRQLAACAIEKQRVVEHANHQAIMIKQKVQEESRALQEEARQQKELAEAQIELNQAKYEAEILLMEAVAASAQVQREARETMAHVIEIKQEAARPMWHYASQCKRCGTSFGFLFVRRHHCRKCGGSFCSACATEFGPLAALGFIEPVRQCESCFCPTGCQPSNSWNMKSYLQSWLTDFYQDTENDESEEQAQQQPLDSAGTQVNAAIPEQGNAVPIPEQSKQAVAPAVVPAAGKGGKGGPAMRGKGGKGKGGPPARGGPQSSVLDDMRRKMEESKRAALGAAANLPKEKTATKTRAPRPVVLDFEAELRKRILNPKLKPASTKPVEAKPDVVDTKSELSRAILSRRAAPSSDDELDWEASGSSIM